MHTNDEDLEVLSKCILFKNISKNNIQILLQHLNAHKKTFKKEEIIFSSNSIINSIGIILNGSAIIENYDIWGNVSVLDALSSSDVFAVSYALSKRPLLVDVSSTSSTTILFLSVDNIIKLCSNDCSFHFQLINNLFYLCSYKNLKLSYKIFHTTTKSIRKRLLSYLSHEAKLNRSVEFYIPYNRQQLADYLNVERSALSNEISKLQKEGIIKSSKNYFKLLNTKNSFGGRYE